MQKRIITRDMLRDDNLISGPDNINKVYKISENEVLKLFSNIYINMHNMTNKPLEERILNAKDENPGIIIPTAVGYLNNSFKGCFEPFINGITEKYYDDNLTIRDRIDLYKYAKHYLKLEKIVKSSPNIVMPDLLTCDNIVIEPNGNLKLIDYDSMQVNGSHAITISTLLNEEEIINSKKYMDNEGIFSKQLDIKSLTHFYFFSAFNMNLSKVGAHYSANKKLTLDDVFNIIKLDDEEIKNKVSKIFSNSQENEYLGEDVLKIAQKYNLTMVYANEKEKIYIKQLVKK